MTTGVGTCHYHSDGNRLIVQYTGVDNVGAGGPYTMQMHLYASGVVEYHYLSLTSPASDSATIGIQNATHDDGLTVAFNATYAHDNLAIRFAPPPPWLAVRPESGSLAAGASLDVEVVFDSAGLCGGRFEGSLHVLSNDPLSPHVVVPVDLALAGTQDIALNPASLSFGAVRRGETATVNLEVSNRGCGDLTVLDLDFDHPDFTSAQSLPLVIAAGAHADVPVTMAPPATGPIHGLLALTSDDPDSPSLAVPLDGTGLDVPEIQVSPASLTETLPSSWSSTRQLTITNNGPTALTYTIDDVEYLDLAAPAAAPGAELPASDPDKGGGGSFADLHDDPIGVNGAGGPDAFGYQWTDNDDARGPDYNWIEIMSTGRLIQITGDNANRGPYNIGFSFPFYDSAFTTFRICSNGWISFTSTSTERVNNALPSSVAPENLIAPYWDDLVFSTYSYAYYHYDGERLIVEFQSVGIGYTTSYCWFQVHLYPSGRIEFHYKAVPYSSGATIGIQNGTRTAGLTVSHNATYTLYSRAVRFEARQPWLSATPAAGTVAAGSSAEVTIGFDATGHCNDAYTADLHVRSNDPFTPDVVVPVTMNVLEAPDARLSPPALAFGDVYLTQSKVQPLKLANIGCVPLQITGLSIDNPRFTTGQTTPFSLAVAGSQSFNVTFLPVASGPAAGILTLTTDDPQRPTLTVPLTGVGLLLPSIVVTPDTLAVIVQPGQQRTATIHLENAGEGPLTFYSYDPALYDKAAAAEGPEIGDGDIAATPLGGGGPDSGGYRWLDSDAVHGPTFSWIEISGTGTAALTAGNDVNVGPFPIGFTFPFYSSNFSTFRVCSNGFLSFTEYTPTQYNSALPSVYAPRNLIAPLWDNLSLDVVGSGDIWYQNVGGNLVVQWDRVMIVGGSAPVTFEVILTPAGTITFQYLSVGGTSPNLATVGIQDAWGTTGLLVAYNAPYLHDNLAIQLWVMPKWATVTPWSGTVPGGGSTDLTVTFKAAGMFPGPHHGLIRLNSNDVAHPMVPVALLMDVRDYVSGVEDPLPTRLQLAPCAPNPFNARTSVRFELPSAGSVRLSVYDVAGRLVRRLVDEGLPPGSHEAVWDGRDASGRDVGSGSYLARLEFDGQVRTIRLGLVR